MSVAPEHNKQTKSYNNTCQRKMHSLATKSPNNSPVKAEVRIYLQLSQMNDFFFLLKCAQSVHAHCLHFVHITQTTDESQYYISQYLHFVLSFFDFVFFPLFFESLTAVGRFSFSNFSFFLFS